MFDIQVTIKWVTAVFTDPEQAATAYRDTSATWQQSFVQLTLTIYVAAYLVAGAIALLTGGSFMLGSLSLGVFVFSILWSLGWTFFIAFIFDFLSGTFEGKRDFNAAYSVVALAIVPSAAGAALAPLPILGWLISLAGSIYSLMLAYRFLPVFLEVPEPARVKHFVLSIIAAVVVNLLVSFTLGSMFLPSMMESPTVGSSSDTIGSGVFGGFERQASYMEEAANDTYTPPSDGELSEKQVQGFVEMMRKTQALRDRLGKSLEGMEDKEPGLADVFSGVGDAVRLSTAEMEVVKTAGGNWAEHLWVKDALETARIQQDLNDATKHNYELFLKFQDDIEQND